MTFRPFAAAEELRYFSTAEDIGIERKPRALLLRQLEATVGPRAQQVLAGYQHLYPNWGDTVVQIASDAVMRFPAIRCSLIARIQPTESSALRMPWNSLLSSAS